MVADDVEDGRSRSPRAAFARRFAELYAAAGNPTLRRVANAAEERMRAARGTRPGAVPATRTGAASAQRISDWKAGRNVPARFESLLPVVLVLVELARKTGEPLPRPLADRAEWHRIWQAATTWNPEADTEAACPYQGLSSYGPEHRGLFFGRARAVAELSALVRSAEGVVAVVGASGAGKSSLLAAGLGPALADWESTTLTPGAHPCTALLTALGRPGTEAATEDALLAALAPRPEGPRRLLIVDQLEELFTAGSDERQRDLFLTVLDAAARRTDDPIAVVVALRADFYAHCLNHLILQDALEHRGYLLGPLRMEELSQAVSGPARAVGLDLEPGLEELITTELCGATDHPGRRTYDPGALPMLSHVMAATWQHREGRRLTIAGYRTAGGVVGSVAETAEYAWNELSSDQQRAARTMLLGLVTVSQDARDTRRTVTREDLLARTDDPEAATAALELLPRTRLLTLDADAVTLTHEIVLTAWPRLRGWIDEDRVGYLARQRLESDAAEWAAQERDSSLLYRGPRLQNAREHADPPPVGPLAQEFLTRSVTAVDTGRRRSRRLRLTLALLGVVLLVLGVGLYSQIRLADQRRADSDFTAVLAAADQARQSDPSLAAQLNLVAWQLRPGDPAVRSRLLQSQAAPLLSVTPAHTQAVSRIAYQPNTRTLASVDLQGGLRLWDTTDPQHPRPSGARIEGVGDVALDPAAPLLATADATLVPSGDQLNANHVVTLWDISNPATPRRLAQLPTDSNPTEVTFAPDGRTLATQSVNLLTLWDVSNPGTPVRRADRPLHDRGSLSGVSAFRFSPNGRLLARIDRNGAARTASIQLWDLTRPDDPTLLVPDFATAPESSSAPSGPTSLAFRADSAVLAVGITPEAGSHAIVQLWDLADPAHPRMSASREIDHGGISDLDFAPDGHSLATAVGAAVTVWNVTDPADPTLLVDGLSTSPGTCRSGVGSAASGTDSFECYAAPRAVAFTADGHHLLAGASTGELHTWSLPSALIPALPGSNDMSVFRAGGSRLAIGSPRLGVTTLWDVRNTQSPKRIAEYRTTPETEVGELSPDGTVLLEQSLRGTSMSVVDLSDPAAVRIRGEGPIPDAGSLRMWAISKDFRTMVTVDDHRLLRLWDFTDPPRTTPLGDPIQVPDKADFEFGPDSKTLIETETIGEAGHSESVTTLWSIAERSHPSRIAELLRRPTSERSIVDFAPDLRTMVVSGKSTFQLWDISDPREPQRLGQPVAAKIPALRGFTFTPDSRTLLAHGFDGVIRLWDLRDRAHPAELATLTPTGGYSDDSVVVADNDRLAAITTEGTFFLWDLDTQHAVDRICSVTGEFWNEDRWKQYLPQLTYRPYCRNG
ncbi:hypothetical protein JMUB6875_41450 [Nocardia sp. JMUB6875]|uniref:nSTAND1 domain-containing NTPase n=1 Tax=Nocardia sp. JMUB6875 TaxID=3158170 RepID=UPI0032E5F1B7